MRCSHCSAGVVDYCCWRPHCCCCHCHWGHHQHRCCCCCCYCCWQQQRRSTPARLLRQLVALPVAHSGRWRLLQHQLLLDYCEAVRVVVVVVALAPAVVASPGHPQQRSKCLPASSKLIDNLFFRAHTTTKQNTEGQRKTLLLLLLVEGSRTNTHSHTPTRIDFTFSRLKRTFKSLLLLPQDGQTNTGLFRLSFPGDSSGGVTISSHTDTHNKPLRRVSVVAAAASSERSSGVVVGSTLLRQGSDVDDTSGRPAHRVTEHSLTDTKQLNRVRERAPLPTHDGQR